MVLAQSRYTLKLEITHSWPGNLRGDKTVHIATHEYLIKYLDVVRGVANFGMAMPLEKKVASLALDQQFRLRNFD